MGYRRLRLRTVAAFSTATAHRKVQLTSLHHKRNGDMTFNLRLPDVTFANLSMKPFFICNPEQITDGADN